MIDGAFNKYTREFHLFARNCSTAGNDPFLSVLLFFYRNRRARKQTIVVFQRRARNYPRQCDRRTELTTRRLNSRDRSFRKSSTNIRYERSRFGGKRRAARNRSDEIARAARPLIRVYADVKLSPGSTTDGYRRYLPRTCRCGSSWDSFSCGVPRNLRPRPASPVAREIRARLGNGV